MGHTFTQYGVRVTLNDAGDTNTFLTADRAQAESDARWFKEDGEVVSRTVTYSDWQEDRA